MSKTAHLRDEVPSKRETSDRVSNNAPRCGLERERSKGVRVFVHLGHGFGATHWQARYSAGLIPGLNEPLPYGYYRAGDGKTWRIEYSEDATESSTVGMLRRGIQRIIGFDLIHAWRNRRSLLGADIIWTHTEREHLAVLLLRRVSAQRRYPPVIAQCVWLFDLWPRLPGWKKAFYRWLLRQADIITTQSPENRAFAQIVFQANDCRTIMFGVGSEILNGPRTGKIGRPVKILALGNDMHRDWDTLISAFGGRGEYRVRIASSSLSEKIARRQKNISLEAARTAQDITDLYGWSDVLVVPLKKNLHASGITVLLEATLFGLPIVCTDTGGLRVYFSDEEVSFVPLGDAAAMREAVDRLVANDEMRKLHVTNAQEHVLSARLTAQGFADQHKRLTEDILRVAPTLAPELFNVRALSAADQSVPSSNANRSYLESKSSTIRSQNW